MRRRAAAAGWRACVAQPGEVLVGELLGRGGFGVVYEARWKGSLVAVKELSVPKELAAGRFGGRFGDVQPTTRRAGWRRLLTTMRGGSRSSLENDGQTSVHSSLLREVEFLSKLRHPSSAFVVPSRNFTGRFSHYSRVSSRHLRRADGASGAAHHGAGHGRQVREIL